MKLWSIPFCGHYPIGAVAVVKASTKDEAVNMFLQVLQVEEPDLYPEEPEGKNRRGQNTRENLLSDCKQITQPVKILLNGRY